MPVLKTRTGGVIARAACLLIVTALLFSLQNVFPLPSLAADSPDLIVEQISLSPAEPELGDTVTITIQVKNQGQAGAASSQVTCYVDAAIIGTNSIDALGPGLMTTTSFQWTAELGTHTIRALSDSAGLVSESDENNNELTYQLTTLAPDLVIESISWSPSAPSVGEPVTFTVRISNIGNALAQTTTLDFYIDSSSRGVHDIPRIEPGESITDTYSWVSQTGQHSIKAFVDNSRRIAESDETNNQKTVTFSTEAPDLQLTEIEADPATPSEFDIVTFRILISNNGTGRADNCHFYYLIDGEPQPMLPVPELAAGASVNVTFTWKAELGTHEFDFLVDYYDRLSESSEDNNSGHIELTTQIPDLVIEDLTWTPPDAGVGDLVTFTVKVKNQGPGNAGATRVLANIDGKYIGNYAIDPLKPDESATTTFQWEATPGSHYVSVTADSDKNEGETNEENNQLKKTFSILPPDLLISSITWAPVNPNLGDTVTFTVNIENEGGGKAENFHLAYYIDDELITTVPVTSLAADNTTFKTYNWKSKEGRHTFKAFVDFNDYVAEENENNNGYSVTIVPNMADLVVHSVTWSPVEAAPGSEVVFNISIKNTGTLATGPSRIAYYVDGATMGYTDIGPVRPDEIITEEFTWPASKSTHTVEIIADSTALVQEIDEKNNSRTVTLPPPDIVVDSVSWSPEGARVGDTITFSVTLRNQGKSSSQPCTALGSIDGEAPVTLSYDAIPAGETLTATFEWIAMKGGHNLVVTADALNSTTELDESNNEKSIDFATLTPDLSVGDISWRMENPLIQSDVYFNVTVLNEGSDNAGSSTMTYTIDDGQELSKEVPEIPAGGSADISIKAFLPTGDHELVLRLDADEVITELDEENNQKTFVFNSNAADLMVKSITWTPLTAVAGDNVTLSASVENRGKGKAEDTVLVFTIDDNVIGEVPLGEIGIGETLVGELVWTIEPGLHQLGAHADYDNAIVETDEANNVSTRTFSLGGPVTATTDQVKIPITGDIPEPGLLSDSWMLIMLIAVVFAGAAFYLLFRSFKKS